MTSPLLSVVIPTHKRPLFLPRAISSALQASPDGDVEIIVVPNGQDESWQPVATAFKHDHRVQWHPIPTAHACAARNQGLVNACGKYIRFLDDDDYLFEGAKTQLHTMESEACEICSGRVMNVDSDGSHIGILPRPDTKDFVIATTLVSGLPLPVGNVFLKSAIEGFRWNENVRRTQDNVWMYKLAGGREWKWTQVEDLVGAWVQHDRDRISTTQISKDFFPDAIPALEDLWLDLNTSNRVNRQRAASIARALWRHIHIRFPYQPVYWTRVAKFAQSIDPSVKPDHPVFNGVVISCIQPIIVEWLLYPGRRLKSAYRNVRFRSTKKNYVRRI